MGSNQRRKENIEWSYETFLGCLVYILCLHNLLIKCSKRIEKVSCKEIKLNNTQGTKCRGSITTWQGDLRVQDLEGVAGEGRRKWRLVPDPISQAWDSPVESEAYLQKIRKICYQGLHFRSVGGRSMGKEASVPRVLNKGILKRCALINSMSRCNNVWMKALILRNQERMKLQRVLPEHQGRIWKCDCFISPTQNQWKLTWEWWKSLMCCRDEPQ